MSSRAQANTIYRAYKQNQLVLPKGFANKMYKVAGMSDYELRHCQAYEVKNAFHIATVTTLAAQYIWDNRIDLAQALIDGKYVERITVTEIVREFEVTQDVIDNPEKYGIDELEILFYEVGDMYTEERHHFEYVVTD